MKIQLFLTVTLAALTASAASADRSFIMPSASNLQGPGAVTIDAAASDNVFQYDHRPIQLQQIKVYRPDGSEAPAPEGVTGRFRSSFDLNLDAPGTWRISAVTVMVNGTAMVGGEERRVSSMRFGERPGGSGGAGGPAMGRPGGGEGRRPEGPGGPGGPGSPNGGPPRQPPILLAELPADATDLKLTEMVGRTEAFVTAGAPTTQVFGGDTRGITLQPITHPTDLVSNELAKFKLLVDGQPASGLKVELIASGQRFRNDEAPIELKTDAQGVVTVKWPAPGYYLLAASAEDNKAAEKRAAVRRLSYAATLEVQNP